MDLFLKTVFHRASGVGRLSRGPFEILVFLLGAGSGTPAAYSARMTPRNRQITGLATRVHCEKGCVGNAGSRLVPLVQAVDRTERAGWRNIVPSPLSPAGSFYSCA